MNFQDDDPGDFHQRRYGDEEEWEVRRELEKNEERQKSYSKEDEEKVREEVDKPKDDKE
jgi:hypothetical protein